MNEEKWKALHRSAVSFFFFANKYLTRSVLIRVSITPHTHTLWLGNPRVCAIYNLSAVWLTRELPRTGDQPWGCRGSQMVHLNSLMIRVPPPPFSFHFSPLLFYLPFADTGYISRVSECLFMHLSGCK